MTLREKIELVQGGKDVAMLSTQITAASILVGEKASTTVIIAALLECASSAIVSSAWVSGDDPIKTMEDLAEHMVELSKNWLARIDANPEFKAMIAEVLKQQPR